MYCRLCGKPGGMMMPKRAIDDRDYHLCLCRDCVKVIVNEKVEPLNIRVEDRSIYKNEIVTTTELNIEGEESKTYQVKIAPKTSNYQILELMDEDEKPFYRTVCYETGATKSGTRVARMIGEILLAVGIIALVYFFMDGSYSRFTWLIGFAVALLGGIIFGVSEKLNGPLKKTYKDCRGMKAELIRNNED